jgi:hypothetical protein
MTENFSAMISFRDPLSFPQQQKFDQQAAQKDVRCEADPRARVRENVIENSERTRTRITNTDWSEEIERNGHMSV